MVADPPISCDPSYLEEIKDAARQLKGEKAAGICDIQSELLKAGSEAALLALCAVFSSGGLASSQPTGRGLSLSLSGRGRVIARTVAVAGVTSLSVSNKVFA